MSPKIKFPIQKSGEKVRVKFNKNIYSANSIKALLDDLDVVQEDEDYWNIEIGSLPPEDIMQSYNYLIYLNRKQ